MSEHHLPSDKRTEVMILKDVNGCYYYAFGCPRRHCAVIGHRHYKTQIGAQRAALAVLKRLNK